MEKEIILDSLKKIQQKILQHWKIAISFLITLILVNLLLMQEMLIKDRSKNNDTPVFRTYKTTGNCFYQKKGSKKWLFLSGEEIISTGSELQTDGDSHGILSFLSQSGRVELSEKTHVGIIENKDDVILDFKKGEIYINYQAGSGQKPLFIKLGDKVFEMTNADLYIYGDVEDQVYASIEYGKTAMKLQGQVNIFEKGHALFFTDRGYSVEESKFKISTPFNYDRYNLKGTDYSVRFAFAPFNKSYQFQLLTGSSIENMKPVFDMPKILDDPEFVVPFQKGAYYWKLIAYDENNIEVFSSHIKKFFVEPQIPLQLVMPLENSKFQLISGKAEVQFQWENSSQLEKVFIEISDRKDFSKTLVHESIPNFDFYNHRFTHVGNYYWRVSGFPFGTSSLLSSEANLVRVVKDVVPEQVKILFPKENAILTTLSLKNSDVTFRWTKNPATSIYTVEINSAKKSKPIVFQTSDTQIKINNLQQGSYSWRVRDKVSGVISDSQEFRVVQTRRLGFINTSEKSGFLNWYSGPRGTEKYRVEALRIGSRSDFNAFFDQNNKSKKSLVISGEKISYQNFSPGIYAFKVYALDAEKNILADSDLKFLRVRK